MANDPQYTKAEATKAAKEATAAAKQLYDDADAVGLTVSTRKITPQERAIGNEVLQAAYGPQPQPVATKAPKPSRDFTASMERTLAGLGDDQEKPRAVAKPAPKPVRVAALDNDGTPESLLPAGFDKPVTVARAPKQRDEVGELIDKYVLNEPAARAPVVTSQDKVEQGIARVTNSKLTQVQRTEAFINELGSNPHFAARFGVNANSAGKLDLDGDRQVEPREYEAVANQLWKDARFKSIEKIAETLGNDKQIAEAARSFGGSMQEGTQVALRVIPHSNPDKDGRQH